MKNFMCEKNNQMNWRKKCLMCEKRLNYKIKSSYESKLDMKNNKKRRSAWKNNITDEVIIK